MTRWVRGSRVQMRLDRTNLVFEHGCKSRKTKENWGSRLAELEKYVKIGVKLGVKTGVKAQESSRPENAGSDMPKNKKKRGREDRYLDNRTDGRFRYQRYVPERFQAAVGKKWIKLSLHTSDLATARIRRDAQELADNELWSALVGGEEKGAATARYKAAVARASALGFAYEPVADLAATAPLSQLVARLERLGALGGADASSVDIEALTGTAEKPKVSVSDAFDVYINEIEAGQRRTKSEKQYSSWLKVKSRAVSNFLEVLGEDKPIEELTRADAKRFWKHWTDRVDAGEVSVNTAERDFGNMRHLFTAYMTWIDRPDVANPFRNFKFGKERTNSRPPFPTEWIRDTILKPGALASMNAEARGVVLAMIETGARPSEIVNLVPDMIRLDDDVPHIVIAPRAGSLRREVKAEASERIIPLVGVSLAAMKANPEGFPRYFENGDRLSAVVNKYLSSNGLLPSTDHTLYCLRHSFEKRMTEADLDYGLRCRLMGHKTSRPVYGDGGRLEWQVEQLNKIALPFSPSLL